jgi:hypothetical protein
MYFRIEIRIPVSYQFGVDSGTIRDVNIVYHFLGNNSISQEKTQERMSQERLEGAKTSVKNLSRKTTGDSLCSSSTLDKKMDGMELIEGSILENQRHGNGRDGDSGGKYSRKRTTWKWTGWR